MSNVLDMESYVYNDVYNHLLTIYPSISIYSVVPRVPAKLPSVSIEQIDDYTIASRATANSRNNASHIVFEVNVFSNLSGGAKTQCKEIMNEIKSRFDYLGFTCIMDSPSPNIADATITRRTARFTVDATQTITVSGQTTTYEYLTYQS